jgi:hypothetical protein
MAEVTSKVCPLIRQVCIKSRCEFFHAALKKCEVPILSYNLFRLAAATKPNAGTSKAQEDLLPGNKAGDERPWNGAPL